jgi:hypothetical protein
LKIEGREGWVGGPPALGRRGLRCRNAISITRRWLPGHERSFCFGVEHLYWTRPETLAG